MGEMGWPKYVGILGWFKWMGMLGWLELACPIACTCLLKVRSGVLHKTQDFVEQVKNVTLLPEEWLSS